MAAQSSKRIYSIGEAAKYLNKSIMTLRRWERDGKISCLKTQGGFRRFTHDELLRIKKFGPLSQSPILTAKEATHELGVSKQTLKRWNQKGKITVLKDTTNHLLLPTEEVEKNSEPKFSNLLDHSIFPHEIIHVGMIALSVVIFLLIFIWQLKDFRVVNYSQSFLLRPVGGALSTLAVPFSKTLATEIQIR